MSCKSRSETAVLPKQGFLEINNAAEGVFLQEGAARVHLAAVVIFVPPPTGDVEIFHGKTQRIESGVTAGTVGIPPVLGELLTDGQIPR